MECAAIATLNKLGRSEKFVDDRRKPIKRCKIGGRFSGWCGWRWWWRNLLQFVEREVSIHAFREGRRLQYLVYHTSLLRTSLRHGKLG